jgi:hypothetical protein
MEIENLLASRHNLKLSCAEDANEIIGSGLPGVIFTLNEIGKDFFVLKNRILGETFQKLVTYHFPIAVVLQKNHEFGERVTELAREYSKHNCIRFCHTLEDAKQWMTHILDD